MTKFSWDLCNKGDCKLQEVQGEYAQMLRAACRLVRTKSLTKGEGSTATNRPGSGDVCSISGGVLEQDNVDSGKALQRWQSHKPQQTMWRCQTCYTLTGKALIGVATEGIGRHACSLTWCTAMDALIPAPFTDFPC